MVGPVGPDADAQIAELETLIEAGVDGLAISSVSTGALAPVINRLLEEGIPVVTYNTDNPDSNRLAFAGQDLISSGYEAAKVLAELLGGEGDVIITTLDAAAQWSIDREGGAREAFAEYPGINVLQTVNTGTEPQEIYAAVENAMLANPTRHRRALARMLLDPRRRRVRQAQRPGGRRSRSSALTNCPRRWP